MPPTKSNSRLLQIFNSLLSHFGPRGWWPSDSAWETIVGAILVQNTAWSNTEKAIASLKVARALSLPRIANLPRQRLEKLIRSSGFFRQKAKRLQGFARKMQKDPIFYRMLCGMPSPEKGEGGKRRSLPLLGGGNQGEGFVSLRQRLLSLNGIGPETADSILLYAGHYPVFVVDAYTRRIGQRIGLFAGNDYHEIQRYFEDALPQKVPLYNEFHALIVTLGKTYCKSQQPKCSDCPLLTVCNYGQKEFRRHYPRVGI